MNAYLVDTSVWISYFRGDDLPAIDLALKEGRVLTTGVIVSELMSGTMNTGDRKKLEDFVNELPIVEAKLNHWIRVGVLRANLSQKGVKVSTPDAHIAQSAMDYECYVCSFDGIFKKISEKTNLRLYDLQK